MIDNVVDCLLAGCIPAGVRIDLRDADLREADLRWAEDLSAAFFPVSWGFRDARFWRDSGRDSYPTLPLAVRALMAHFAAKQQPAPF